MRSKLVMSTLILLATAAANASAMAVGSDGDAQPDQVEVPEGYRQIVDDTGTITLSVPQSWTTTYTSPGYLPDGTVHPSIQANAPSGFPSVGLWAEPYNPDVTINEIVWCTGAFESFSVGGFTGERATFTECEDNGGLQYQDVAASSAGQELSVSVSFAYESAADEATFDTILGTMALTGSPYPTPVDNPPIGCFVRCHEEEAPADDPVADSDLPLADAGAGAPVWPYGRFSNVPRLGAEPVLGSDCGSQGQMGETIPDGLVAGYVTTENTATIGIDLLCIYSGAAAEHVLAEGTANLVNDDPNYLIVNNNTRVRTMPGASGLVLRDSAVVNGECVEQVDAVHNPQPPRQAWIRIHNGEVTWILWGCGDDSSGGPEAPEPSNLPPAFPDANGSVWPYGQFWNVPQLGTEPVRGSDCGASGQIGPRIPDGLVAGYVGSDAANGGFWIDLLCIFSGATAQSIIAEGTANIVSNEPDYLIVNNSTQTRFVAGVEPVVVLGTIGPDGQCVEGEHASFSGTDTSVFDQRAGQQAWIRVHNGTVTWIFYGCG